ncbi:UNVERIFIED_ORG: hypothetical protein M2438_000381 [Methylobacterium sp. SuP10 SLI 274]|uniref:hypothetical protein n=1 Tax=Methylorubrum extorquens TaxID=408 RepID=UPI00209D53F4|nr:hypothetical protein [Methylorubrum extorquens]MDF9861580.1 hypothetical protein [Methylorubrum pseudosasae]MDH6635206.1 hypothetical protein [Methylobacterium sp. SuP10 SLI 274]MDH6664376.1 hypothetical protein [Methylorubrum zatmanii]MCP1561378.1 hypothetical protein [Methylorubrum extorquens]MDF9789873.1 hypothetical protein [Methylorubrum extorquens]
MTGSNRPILHVSVVAGVLLTLAIPSSAQAKPSDKPQTQQNGSPGGSADKDQKAEKSDQKDVDTEHLFGFTEGADAGEKGEQEVVIDTVTRVSKRRDGPGPSTYRVLDTRFAYQFNPIDKLSIEFSAFGTLRRQRNIVDLDDKSYGTFDGVSMEVKYQFLKGTKEQPLGLALEVRPRFTRILPVEGNGANIFDIESLLQIDVQVVPDKLWYGSNISFEPAAGRQRGGGPGYRSSTFLWSNVLVGRIGENTYFGPEVRYLRGYEGIFLNQLESEALTVGPALHHRFTEKIWLTAAYAGQVWGRDADPTLAGRALGLNQFERHNVRVKFGMEF